MGQPIPAISGFLQRSYEFGRPGLRLSHFVNGGESEPLHLFIYLSTLNMFSFKQSKSPDTPNEPRKCPKCAEEIQQEAKKCKHCGASTPPPPGPIAKTVAGIIIFIFVATIFNQCSQTNNSKRSSSSTKTEKNHMSVAYVCAQNKVKDSLKSPSTADFPWESYTDVTKELRKNEFQIKSYVDSQNSFGAEVRTHYDCNVIVTDPDDFRCITNCEFHN